MKLTFLHGFNIAILNVRSVCNVMHDKHTKKVSKFNITFLDNTLLYWKFILFFTFRKGEKGF